MNLVKTGILLAALTSLFLVAGYLLGGPAGALIALLVALGMNAYAFWNSDKMALDAHAARPVTRASAPELIAMVEDLSVKADLPMPEVYVIDSPQPNAFATGRSPDKAAVAATTGIMQMLDRHELAGVMA
ncbi:MAG: M48 family metalloprotease, partial [Pseudomonadota bacterium]